MTSRRLVHETLELNNKIERAPRQIWALPWAEIHYPGAVSAIENDFPGDFGGASTTYSDQGIAVGDPYKAGKSTDAWGCVFENLIDGIHGEIKNPIIDPEDSDWDDLSRVHIPYEWLSFDVDEVNSSYRASDKFILCGACPRPFEQLQFLRGSENFFVDIMFKPKNMLSFIKKIHAFYCELLEKWAKTEVDALNFMDDWGAQFSLLINPRDWREIFKPLYRDYVDIAHSNNKKIFMHSDGHILEIIPDIIEIGVDALNSQIFCMGTEKLAQFKGKITFWGEMDRQHIMPFGSREDVRAAVRSVVDNLWMDGGCVAQCEFGANTKPENVRELFAAWDEILLGGNRP